MWEGIDFDVKINSYLMNKILSYITLVNLNVEPHYVRAERKLTTRHKSRIYLYPKVVYKKNKHKNKNKIKSHSYKNIINKLIYITRCILTCYK